MIDFGSDVSTFPDLDPTFAELTGPNALGQAIARRLMTPRGTLDYDPDYGLDVRSLLSAAFDDRRVFSVRAQLQAEIEKDERVLSASVALEVVPEASTLRAHVALETADGPFRLTLAIDSVTVSLLTLD